MGEFKINIPSLSCVIDEALDLTYVLKTSASEVKNIKNELNMQIRQRERINSRLSISMRDLEGQGAALRRVANTGKQVARLYEQTENQITKQKPTSTKRNKTFEDQNWLISMPWIDLAVAVTGAVIGKTGKSTEGSFHTPEKQVYGTFSALTGKMGVSRTGKIDLGEKTGGIECGITGKGHLLEGKVDLDSGALHSKYRVSAGNIAVAGSVGATLFKNGKLSPYIKAGTEVKVSAVEGEMSHRIGTKENNGHVNTSGSLLTAKVKGEVGVGKIDVKTKEGERVEAYGVQAKVGAEAYLAEGRVKGGITICGIDIDVSFSGKAGGAGVSAGGSISTAGIKGEVGVGLGLGAGATISVDWSDFKLPFW